MLVGLPLPALVPVLPSRGSSPVSPALVVGGASVSSPVEASAPELLLSSPVVWGSGGAGGGPLMPTQTGVAVAMLSARSTAIAPMQ